MVLRASGNVCSVLVHMFVTDRQIDTNIPDRGHGVRHPQRTPANEKGGSTISRNAATSTPGHELDRLLALDVDLLDAADIRSVIGDVARVSGKLASFESRLRDRQQALLAAPRQEPTMPLEEGERPEPAPPPPSPGMLDGLLGISPAEGRRRDARADALGRIPELRRFLEAGRISVEHVDQVANCGRNVHPDLATAFWACGAEIAALCTCSQPGALRRRLEAIVTRLAAAAGVDRSERRRQMTKLGHRFDPATGMGRIWAELDPDLYERFVSILERSVRGRTDADAPSLDWIRAHALVDLMAAGVAAGPGAPAVPSVSVLIDHETLLSGLHSAGICEYSDGTALDVATARQLACEANIYPVVLGGAGQPLDVGHSRRLATAAQRLALAAVRATCAIEGCTVTIAPFAPAVVGRAAALGPLRPPSSAMVAPSASLNDASVRRRRWDARSRPSSIPASRASHRRMPSLRCASFSPCETTKAHSLSMPPSSVLSVMCAFARMKSSRINFPQASSRAWGLHPSLNASLTANSSLTCT